MLIGAFGPMLCPIHDVQVSLVSMLDKQGLRPCVVFTFSKKRCESNADSLMSLDLTSSAEKSEVQVRPAFVVVAGHALWTSSPATMARR